MEMVRKKGEEEKKKREIPEEIIVEEIVWRLPVKPLVCFRSVCKTWNSIIAFDPKFAILQLKNSSTCFDHRLRVMLWDSLEDFSAFFLENSKNQPLTSSNNNSEFAIKKINTSPIKVEDLSRCSIVAACDGLVCILQRVTNSIFFWNPLTGETKRVSDPPGGIPPFKSKPTFGLGYDSSTDDYKLVLINLSYRDVVPGFLRPTEVRVFSLRTNSWRQIQDFRITIFSSVPGVFTNGALYWTGFSVGSLGCHAEVASFCLEKENYRLLDIPLTHVWMPSFRFLVQALGDKLAVYYESKVDGSYRLLLNDPCENSESWTKHTLILPNDGWFTPLCLLENVEEVLFKVSRNQFGVYSFRDGTFRHLQIIGLPETFSAITFSESLISPNTFRGRRIDIKSMAIEEEDFSFCLVILKRDRLLYYGFPEKVHFAATEEALSLHFAKCGVVLKVVILNDMFSGQPKGSAYITFANKESVDKAVSLSGTSFFSRIVKVTRKANEAAVGSAPPQRAGKPSQAQSSQTNTKRPFYTSSHLQWCRDSLPAPSEPSI